jgi:hypothetical protein
LAVIHRQAALCGGTGAAVYATTRAPEARYRARARAFYWVAGAAESAMRDSIGIGETGAPYAATVAIVEIGPTVVVMTDAPPVGGVFSEAAGEPRVDRRRQAPGPRTRAALAAAFEPKSGG